MAINKNHEFEELNGIKCGIVEKNVSVERVEFLRNLLTANGYEVVVVNSPAPKAAPAPVSAASDPEGAPVAPPAPELPTTFTIGVTDYTFNPINAIFGRLLKTSAGHVVTLAYWKQETENKADEKPYYERE